MKTLRSIFRALHFALFRMMRAIDRDGLRFPPGPDFCTRDYGSTWDDIGADHCTAGRLWERSHRYSPYDCDPRAYRSTRTPHTATWSNDFTGGREVFFGVHARGPALASWAFSDDGGHRLYVLGRTLRDHGRRMRRPVRLAVVRVLFGRWVYDALRGAPVSEVDHPSLAALRSVRFWTRVRVNRWRKRQAATA